MSLFATKVILLSLGVVVLGGAGYSAYHYIATKDSDSTVEAKITGVQATAKNITVTEARIDAGAVNYGTEENIVAGYTATAYVKLNSTTKLSKVALEELKVNNLSALGDCTTSEKDASIDTFIPSIGQRGYISFKLSCRTGVSYSVDSVLATSGEWSGMKLLSYAGLTPGALQRSLTFDVAAKYDDGTIARKSFNGTISGQTLFNGDFGAGSLSGQGDSF